MPSYETGVNCLLTVYFQIAGYPTVKLIHKGQPTAYSGAYTACFGTREQSTSCV
jgi:hypothetical protein